MRMNTAPKGTENMKVASLKKVINLNSFSDIIFGKSLKLFVHILRSSMGFDEFCFALTVPGKRSRRKPKHSHGMDDIILT